MWLLIDDERNLGCDVIARTAEAGKALLAAHKWEGVCLDHDLGCDETGYHVLNWAIENGHLPSAVQLVTSNPPGRERMGLALEAAGYEKLSPFDYEKKNP